MVGSLEEQCELRGREEMDKRNWHEHLIFATDINYISACVIQKRSFCFIFIFLDRMGDDFGSSSSWEFQK